MSKSQPILISLHGAFPFSEIAELVSEEPGFSLDSCFFSDSAVFPTSSNRFRGAVCLFNGVFPESFLNQLLETIENGATVVFKGGHSDNDSEVQSLKRNCLFKGFLLKEFRPESKYLKVAKPEWEAGSKSEIRSRSPKKWTMDLEDDLVDDEEYITEEDLKPAPLIQQGQKPVKKACENCTCGRAEGKEPVKLTKEMIENPVTSCGSCGLGDAYRCANCPYRGLPTFEPGKKIQLPEDFLISDLE